MDFSFNNSGTARKAGKHDGLDAAAARRSAAVGKGGSLAPASGSAAARVTAEKAVARRRKAEARAKASDGTGAVGAPSARSGSSAASGVEREGASAARPTRRSARGSEAAAREKQEQRSARGAASGMGGAVAGAGSASVGPRKKGPSSERSRATRRSGRETSGGGAEKDRATQRALMKYAADNRVVTWVYDFTTGPSRHFFYLAVVVLVVLGAYFPVRDFYVAFRTEQILQEQNEIQNAYNEKLGSEVEGLLSEEGVKDAARKDFGMVMPGEQTITVEGLDEDGQPVTVDVNQQDSTEDGAAEAKDPTAANGAASKDDSEVLKGADAAKKDEGASGGDAAVSGKTPATSAEVEAAERAVLENSAWYWKVLDTLFGFTGADGMAIVSTGDGE